MNQSVSAIGVRDGAWTHVLRAWWVMCVAVVATGGWLALTKTADHDIALWIDAVERSLLGAELYRDIYEINPPVAFLLTIPPVLAAHALGVEPIVMFQLFVIATAIASVLLVQGMVRAMAGDQPLVSLLPLPLLLAVFVAPGKDFGQREHILAILLLPYFVGTMANGARLPGGLRLAIGALAGLGIALKPFFGIYLLAAEALVGLRARDLRAVLRIEPAAAAAVVAAAVAVTLLAFPGYLEFVVPLGREIYHGYENTLVVVLLLPAVSGSAILLACTAALFRATRIGNMLARDLVVTFAVAALAGFIAYFVQHKGWRYQALPVLIFSSAALGVACTAALEPHLASLQRWRMGLIVAVATVAGMTISGARDWLADERLREVEIRPLTAFVSSLPAPRRALFLSTHLFQAFPVVPVAEASWPYRYYHLIPLPGLYRDFDVELAGRPFRTPSQMGPTEARFFDTVVTDALRFPPQAILVDRRLQVGQVTGFDFFAYFSQDPRFARMAEGFRYIGRIAKQDVYVRAD